MNTMYIELNGYRITQPCPGYYLIQVVELKYRIFITSSLELAVEYCKA